LLALRSSGASQILRFEGESGQLLVGEEHSCRVSIGVFFPSTVSTSSHARLTLCAITPRSVSNAFGQSFAAAGSACRFAGRSSSGVTSQISSALSCGSSWRSMARVHQRRERLDALRDEHLQRAGYRVLRLPAALVTSNLAAAVELVRAALG
jgi:hypothetical protein